MGKVVDALIQGEPLGKLAWDAIGVDAWWEVSVGKYIREALIPTPDDDFGNEAMAQQQMLRSPTEARRCIYGKAMVSGPIVFAEESGIDNEYLHLVIPLAAHRCTEVLEIYFDDTLVYSEGSLDAEYSDHARINIHLGDQTTADADLVSECDNWTAEHLGLGITYLYVRLKYDPEFFASGLPNIKALVKGKPLYDPRKDSTVGGSGSHRWDDDSTWEWSDNWALCVLDYTRFESGVGALASEIDLPSYALAANDSDELVEYDDEGNSEPRYTCNGTFTQSMTPSSVLDKLLTAGAGMQTYCSGRYQLYSGVYQGPYVLSLGEADLAGEVELRPFTPRAALCNAVRGTFVDPDNFYQPTDFSPYESAYYRAQDNDEYIDQDIDLPFTQSTYTAQRLAKLYLELNRAGQQISVPLNMIGLSISVGQVVELDLPRLGIKAEYQVMDWSFDFGQPIKVTLRETAASLFDYDKGSYTSRKLTPVLNLPSPTRVPTPTGVLWTAMGDDANWQGLLKWDAPGGNSAYRYRLEVSNSSDVVVYQANIDGTQHHIPKLDAGDYAISLWAVNLFANRSNVPAMIAIGASVPPPVTGLVVEAGSLSLTITPQTAAATAQSTSFEVYGAQTNVFTDALLVGSGKTVVWAERLPATEYYLWARTVNNYGFGAWFGPTLVTTAQDSTPILDLIMDDLVIEENHLTQSLRDSIDLIGQINDDYITSAGLSTVLTDYVSDDALTTILASYVSDDDLSNTLGSYVTSAQLATADYAANSSLTAYVKTDDLNTTLSSYVTNTALANADYATNSSLASYATAASVTAVEQRMTANENEAFYSLKVDANGRVAGIGLLANPDETAIYFNADKFIVLPPDSDDATESVSPFIIDATTGKTVIADALVRNLTAANFVGGSITADSLAVTQYVNLPSGSLAEDMLDADFLSSLVRIDPSAVTTGGTETGSGTCVSRTLTLAAILSGGLTTKLRVYMPMVWDTGTGSAPSAPSVTITLKRDSTTLSSQTFSGSVITPPGDPWELHFSAINWEVSDAGTTQGANHVYSAVISVTDTSGVLSSKTISLTASEPVGSSGSVAVQSLQYAGSIYMTANTNGASVVNGDLWVNNFNQRIADAAGYLYDNGTLLANKFAALSHTHSASAVGLGSVDNARQMRASLANGYWGLCAADGSATNWIRTTVNGIIPYQSGGYSSLGTSSWPFATVYANSFIGDLSGNAASATKLATARTIAGKSFDGTANISITIADLSGGGAANTNGPTWNGRTIWGDWLSRLFLGNTAGPTTLASSDNPKVRVGSSDGTIYTTLNKPTAADVGALPLTGGTLSGDLYTTSATGIIFQQTATSTARGMWFNNGATKQAAIGCHWNAVTGGVVNFYFGTGSSPWANRLFAVDGSGNGTFAGTCQGTDAIATSDERVKSNIVPIPNPLEKIEAIGGFTFNRLDMDGRRHAGVIAQHVEKVLPEAIFKTDDDKLGKKLNVSSSAMIGLLVAGEDALIKENRQLKSKVAALNNSVTTLESQLATINRRLSLLEAA